MTKQEEILHKHVSLYFSSHHDKSRWNGEGEHGGAEWHTDKAIAADIYAAMDEYAKQQAAAFVKWAIDAEKIVGDSWGDAFIRDHSTEEELYNQFIEQQNKDNGNTK